MEIVNVLLFGSSGTLGAACKSLYEERGWLVVAGNRDIEANYWEVCFDAVVWAQGTNLSKSFEETTDDDWLSILHSNLLFVVQTLKKLLQQDQLAAGARLVVLGSVWEKVHRKNKSAYITSKSALAGLVRALSSDLGNKGMSINCVSPGIVQSRMTSQHLSAEQIARIEQETPNSKLVSPLEVAKVVGFLISQDSSGISGQTIFVDNGWSDSHNV